MVATGMPNAMFSAFAFLGGGNADHFAQRVEPRAAGTAGVDGGVGLDHSVKDDAGQPAGPRGPPNGAEHAGGAGQPKSLGVADDDHRLADHEVAVAGEFDRRQRAARLDLQQRQIAFSNHGQQFRRQPPAVAERHLVEKRPFHGMGVRQDVARLMDDAAAAQARDFSRRRGRAKNSSTAGSLGPSIGPVR